MKTTKIKTENAYVLVDTTGDRITKTVLADNDEDAREQLDEWLREGWGCEGDVWVDGHAYPEDEDTDRIETSLDYLPPLAPDCADGHEHEWIAPHSVLGGLKENPGVWGHGGGIVYEELCEHCHVKRVTDTWATNPINGTQGHRVVRYESGHIDDDTGEWFAE